MIGSVEDGSVAEKSAVVLESDPNISKWIEVRDGAPGSLEIDRGRVLASSALSESESQNPLLAVWSLLVSLGVITNEAADELFQQRRLRSDASSGRRQPLQASETAPEEDDEVPPETDVAEQPEELDLDYSDGTLAPVSEGEGDQNKSPIEKLIELVNRNRSSNSPEGQNTVRELVDQVVNYLKQNQPVADDLLEALAVTVLGTGVKLTLEQRREVLWAIVEHVANPGRQERTQFSEMVRMGAEEVREFMGLPKELQPAVEIALVQEMHYINATAPEGEELVGVRDVVLTASVNRAAAWRLRDRILDAISFDDGGSPTFDYLGSSSWGGMVYGLADIITEVSNNEYLQSDGSILVNGRRMAPFLSFGDQMMVAVAIYKSHKQQRMTFAQFINPQRSVVDAVLEEADRLRRTLGLDESNQRASEVLSEHFYETSGGIFAVEGTGDLPSSDLYSDLGDFFAPRNETIVGLMGLYDSGMEFSLNVVVSVVDMDGREYEAIMEFDAEDLIRTINADNIRAMDSGNPTSEQNIRRVFEVRGKVIEILEIPGVPDNVLKDIQPPSGREYPDWNPIP